MQFRKQGRDVNQISAPPIVQIEPAYVTDRPIFFEYLSPKNAPVIEGLEQFEVVYAKDQPEYIPLRTLPSNNRERFVLSRWDLTWEQRQAVSRGADVFLELMTFGGPLQPIRIAVGDKPNAAYFRSLFGYNAGSRAN